MPWARNRGWTPSTIRVQNENSADGVQHYATREPFQSDLYLETYPRTTAHASVRTEDINKAQAWFHIGVRNTERCNRRASKKTKVRCLNPGKPRPSFKAKLLAASPPRNPENHGPEKGNDEQTKELEPNGKDQKWVYREIVWAWNQRRPDLSTSQETKSGLWGSRSLCGALLAGQDREIVDLKSHP